MLGSEPRYNGENGKIFTDYNDIIVYIHKLSKSLKFTQEHYSNWVIIYNVLSTHLVFNSDNRNWERKTT